MGISVGRVLGPNECFHTKGNTAESFFMSQTMVYNDPTDCDCHIRGKCPEGEPALPPTWEFHNDPGMNMTGPPTHSLPKDPGYGYTIPGQGFPGEGIQPRHIEVKMTEPSKDEQPRKIRTEYRA